MFNLDRILPKDHVLTLEGVDLNKAIGRQLGYREGRDLSIDQHEEEWFVPSPEHGDYQPVPASAMEFSTNASLVFSLALPGPTDCCEDWIHTEMGPQGRWIIRLIRFYRATASQPWKSRELYVADRDDDPIPMATAYGRAWLFSHSTWPAEQRSRSYEVRTFAGRPAA